MGLHQQLCQLFHFLLKTIFTIKNLLCGILVAGGIYHLRSVPKDESFTQDIIIIFFMFFSLIMVVIRSIKPYWLRIIVSGSCIGVLYSRYPYQWSTILLLTLLLIY